MTQLSLNESSEEDRLRAAVCCLLNNLPQGKISAYTAARQHGAESAREMIKSARHGSGMQLRQFRQKLKKNIANDSDCQLDLASTKAILNDHLPIKKGQQGEVEVNKLTYEVFDWWFQNIFPTHQQQ